MFGFYLTAKFSKPLYICTSLAADLTMFFCMWSNISKSFSPFCEKLQSAKNHSKERHDFKGCRLWTVWFYSDDCWVGDIFLISAIAFTGVLHVALCYSFGITLQSFDSVYFLAWHCIIKPFSSTNFSVQKLAKEALFMELYKAFNWLWKACGYWIWNHF